MTKVSKEKAFGLPETRNDDEQARRWAQKRVIHTEANLPKDPGLSFEGDPGRTDKSQAAETDVNLIVDRFMKTGVLPGVNVERVYGDFSDVVDYQTAMNTVIQANEQFMGLNAKVRKQFDNDPAQFLAFVNDPENAQELIKMGLTTPRADTGDKSNGEAPASPAGKGEPGSPPSPASPPSKT